MMSSGEWLSDLANEDPEAIMHHCNMMMRYDGNEIDGDMFDLLDDVFQSSNDTTFAIKSNNNFVSDDIETKKITTSNNNNNSNSCWSSSGELISFGSSDLETNKGGKKKRGIIIGSTSNNQGHVFAERRRREKMTQGFLALSALIPGLKKTDKASILGETAEYLKQLEERAKFLEEQTTKRTVESVCLVKKMQINQTSKTLNFDDNNLEIEAKILNANNILIKIHTLKKQGLIQNIFEEIGKLNLTTLNCQTLPFGSYAIDITIIAKASDDFAKTTEGLVQHLGNALQNVLIV